MRFHYVIPDGDGEPKFQHLAELLATFIINYCFSAKKLQNPTPQSLSKLFMQARDLFRKYEHSGQAGEVLIYFLLESILSAPQVLQKMPITTNTAEERKGGDGLHAKWNPELQLLDVFFSESKLYRDFSAALNDAFISMERFHATPMRAHEYFLATHNLQLLDPVAQEQLVDFFLGKPDKNIRTNHACLLGFDWDEYSCLDDARRVSFLSEFALRYASEAQRIRDKIDSKLSVCSIKNFRFEFFMVPFRSVKEFRVWFNRALTGVKYVGLPS
jgi:Cap4 SAVED domain